MDTDVIPPSRGGKPFWPFLTEHTSLVLALALLPWASMELFVLPISVTLFLTPSVDLTKAARLTSRGLNTMIFKQITAGHGQERT